ncbi:MAG: hypothetical protein ACRCX4_12155 [Bacteroidales bacterium]
MKKEQELKSSEATRKAFKVPENYFEELNAKVMSQLPESEPVFEHASSTLWSKIRPVLYMAAMFMGIILSVKLFIGEKPHSSNQSDAIYSEVITDQVITDTTYEETMTDYAVASMDDYTLVESYALLTNL